MAGGWKVIGYKSSVRLQPTEHHSLVVNVIGCSSEVQGSIPYTVKKKTVQAVKGHYL